MDMLSWVILSRSFGAIEVLSQPVLLFLLANRGFEMSIVFGASSGGAEFNDKS